jgi:septal ring factor EnvC (AmiA/AmiB activator)
MKAFMLHCCRNIFTAAAIAFMALTVLPMAAYAENPPLPERKDDALNTVKDELKQEEKHQADLSRKAKSIEKDLKNTRGTLTDVANSVRKNQQNLETLATKINDLSAEQEAMTADLEKNYGSIADLILALERIKRIPPEALIVRPGAPLETAQTALLLKGVLPAVYEKADQLSAALTRLDDIETTLKEDRAEQIALKAELANKEKEMTALLKKRERLFANTQSDLKKTEQNLKQLAQKAQNLEDLLNRVKEENRARTQSSSASARKASVPIPQMGDGILPVNGRILTTFGQRDEIGATSQGLKIEATPASLVTSPLGGVIRFSGEFKNYGNLLIVEHKNGYHSLIAGFGQTNVKTGQAVNAGEPIGKLPYTSSRGGRPTLYYELRYKGRAIDPSQKLSKLKS